MLVFPQLVGSLCDGAASDELWWMATPESDPIEHDAEAGFWYELRDADNTTLYRQVLQNPVRYDAEIYLEDEQTIVRQAFDDYADTFDLLAPALASATQIALFSSPLNPETLGEAYYVIGWAFGALGQKGAQ